MRTFDYIQDPSHGWVKVPIKLLAELNLLGQISPYSYMRKNFAYLEEDSDYAKFYAAFTNWRRLEPVLKSRISKTRPSIVRSYERFNKAHVILKNSEARALYMAGKLQIVEVK